jgi:hypothetical protein
MLSINTPLNLETERLYLRRVKKCQSHTRITLKRRNDEIHPDHC